MSTTEENEMGNYFWQQDLFSKAASCIEENFRKMNIRIRHPLLESFLKQSSVP